jgi:hypothetical protein
MDKPEHDSRRPAACAWADFDQIAAAAMDDPHTMLHQLRAACPNGGALMLHNLATHPDARAEIVARPDQLEPAVEELLRLTSPVPQHARGVGEDTEFLGQHLKSSDVVLVHWVAANRDPEVLRRLPDYEVVPAEVVRYPGLNPGMSGLGARFTPGSQEEAEQ